MTNLPKAILSAWTADDVRVIPGFMQMVGIDPDDHFLPRAIKDHPWLGLQIKLPNGVGHITNCLTHPLGQLMFDVSFPDPVPPMLSGRIIFENEPNRYEQTQRFYGQELVDMAKVLPESVGGTNEPR